MENMENLVTEVVAENVEQTTEQTQKLYTEEEFNAKVNEVSGKRTARKEAKIRKELEREYGDLIEVLKAGTGKETVAEIKDTFADFYQKKGIEVRKQPTYSERDTEVLARAEAEEIIGYGYDEVVEEVERLAKIGVSNMTPRYKAVFRVLAEHRQNAERSKELSKLGVTEEEYKSKEFTDFASKFNANTPMKDIYDIYRKTKPKKEIKTMGSMTNKSSEDGTVKDFYTRDEALQFTKKDFDKNPALYKAVTESMLKW